MRPPVSTLVLSGSLVLWGGGVAAGFYALELYDRTPGTGAGVIAQEPTVRPSAGQGRWALDIFIHPRCPCSRASLSELQALVRELPPDVAVRVLFVRPEGAAEGWERSSLWSQCREMDRVAVVIDVGGESARKAGATTSGHAVLFDATGRAAFRGGITAGRGRPGESVGRRAIRELVNGRPSLREAPVFGCPLSAPRSCNAEGSDTCQQP